MFRFILIQSRHVFFPQRVTRIVSFPKRPSLSDNVRRGRNLQLSFFFLLLRFTLVQSRVRGLRFQRRLTSSPARPGSYAEDFYTKLRFRLKKRQIPWIDQAWTMKLLPFVGSGGGTFRHFEFHRHLQALVVLPVPLMHYYSFLLDRTSLWNLLLVDFYNYYRH